MFNMRGQRHARLVEMKVLMRYTVDAVVWVYILVLILKVCFLFS